MFLKVCCVFSLKLIKQIQVEFTPSRVGKHNVYIVETVPITAYIVIKIELIYF